MSWYNTHRLMCLDKLIEMIGKADIGKERWIKQENDLFYDEKEKDIIKLDTVIDRAEKVLERLGNE